MTTKERYDAVVIGAGQAGVPLSTTLARAGWKTALIEREHVGGTCVNEGCAPTKTMVASARVAYLARRAAEYGVHTRPPVPQQWRVTVDMAKVRQRKRDIVNSFRNGSQWRIENTEGLDLLMGEASFTGPKSVEVHVLSAACPEPRPEPVEGPRRRVEGRMNSGETRLLTADKIFINTGARPRKPSLTGLNSVPYLDSTSIMELDEVPEHLLVLGGGYVGLEFGQMFRRLCRNSGASAAR